MIFLVAVLIGVAVGYARGGRIRRLAGLRLRAPWLILGALILQLSIFPLFSSRPLIPHGTAALHLLSYGALFIWLLLNLRLPPVRVIGLGAATNGAVILANGGYMPASATALARAGIAPMVEHLAADGAYGNVILMSEATRWNALGDILYLPEWIPFATAFSIGDLAILFGLAWLIARGMKADGA